MSDLAPLVAAAIRDQTFSDLQDECARLRAKVEANTHAIEVTGPGGYPTYFGSTNGGYDIGRLPKARSVGLGLFLDAEVHIAGLGKVATFREMAHSSNWNCYFDVYNDHAAHFGFEAIDTKKAGHLHWVRFHMEDMDEATKDSFKVFLDPSESNQQEYYDCDQVGYTLDGDTAFGLSTDARGIVEEYKD